MRGLVKELCSIKRWILPFKVLRFSYKMPLVLASAQWDHCDLGSETIKGEQLNTEGRRRRNSSQHGEGERRRRIWRWECAVLTVGVSLLGSRCSFSFQNSSLVPHPDLTHDQLSLFTIPALVNHSDQLISTTKPWWWCCMHEATQEEKQRTKTKSLFPCLHQNKPSHFRGLHAVMLFLRAITSQSSLCNHHIPRNGSAIVEIRKCRVGQVTASGESHFKTRADGKTLHSSCIPHVFCQAPLRGFHSVTILSVQEFQHLTQQCCSPAVHLKLLTDWCSLLWCDTLVLIVDLKDGIFSCSIKTNMSEKIYVPGCSVYSFMRPFWTLTQCWKRRWPRSKSYFQRLYRSVFGIGNKPLRCPKSIAF